MCSYISCRRVERSFASGEMNLNRCSICSDLFDLRIRARRVNETCLSLVGKRLTDFPSIFPRGHFCRRPSFVASIHRPQEAIRSFPIRERESRLIFRAVRDLHCIPQPEAVDQEGPRRDSEVAEEPARFLPFVAHGSATRDIVSIVPLIGKIKVFPDHRELYVMSQKVSSAKLARLMWYVKQLWNFGAS